MARLYADEMFPKAVVELLRGFGRDVLTVQEAGKASQKIPDEEVLAFAVSNERAVITLNRFDFIGLHSRQPNHAGIIVCSENLNFEMLADRINEALNSVESLKGMLIRVYKSPPSM